MLQLKKFQPNKVLVIVLFSLLICTSLSILLNTLMVSQIVKLITVTVLFTFYFCQLNRMANLFITIFIVFFIGDAFSVFQLGDITSQLSRATYILGYVLLVYVLLRKLKRIKFQGIVTVYLIIVLLLNSYFLYTLYGVAKNNFVDTTNLVIYICHGITLIALMYFSFAAYLSKETAQSITFLLMVFCFVFSDVLYYICSMYVYFWVFEVFENLLHIAGLFLFYKYVYDHQTQRTSDKRINFSQYFIPTTEKLREISVNF